MELVNYIHFGILLKVTAENIIAYWHLILHLRFKNTTVVVIIIIIITAITIHGHLFNICNNYSTHFVCLQLAALVLWTPQAVISTRRQGILTEDVRNFHHSLRENPNIGQDHFVSHLFQSTIHNIPTIWCFTAQCSWMSVVK